MKYALINPRWRYEGSIYFGCRDPHLPLEMGYARTLLERHGHSVMLLDAHVQDLPPDTVRHRVEAFAPDFTVVPTAPGYLFWRCPPPELRVPRELLRSLGDAAGCRVLVGPHPSTTPAAALRKTGADIAVLGECEEVLPRLASPSGLDQVAGIARLREDRLVRQGGRQNVDLTCLPAIHWSRDMLHRHHHHRFDQPRHGLGAEMETSRGCFYACSFCAKSDHRDSFRRRPLSTVLEELDGLLAQGVTYVYFIDEIFLPDRELLLALRERRVRFGIQTRVDLWKHTMLDLLGEAGCVSLEAGVESISDTGRQWLHKQCRLDTEALSGLLIHARRHIPFVQATLLDAGTDDPARVAYWRRHLNEQGVWANKPVPLFPYPGSPDYLRRWGPPDDQAWERALDHYLADNTVFSDVQEQAPRPLAELEHNPGEWS